MHGHGSLEHLEYLEDFIVSYVEANITQPIARLSSIVRVHILNSIFEPSSGHFFLSIDAQVKYPDLRLHNRRSAENLQSEVLQLR